MAYVIEASFFNKFSKKIKNLNKRAQKVGGGLTIENIKEPYLNRLSQLFPREARKSLKQTISDMEGAGIWTKENRKSEREGISTYCVLIINEENHLVQVVRNREGYNV